MRTILNNSLDKWEPPDYIKKICSFYVSGFDDEDRPSDDQIFNIILKTILFDRSSN